MASLIQLFTESIRKEVLRKLSDGPDDPRDGEDAVDDGQNHDPETVVDAAAALVQHLDDVQTLKLKIFFFQEHRDLF